MKADPKESLQQFPPPRDARCPFDPPPELMRRLRDEPISKMKTWDGNEAWVIARYEDGRAALRDERFSADPQSPGFPEKSVAYVNTIGRDRNIRTLDNPEHDRQKRMMVSDFALKRVEEIRPYVQNLVDGLIDDMLKKKPPFDLLPGFAVSLPTLVICELLGVPYEKREFFRIRAKTVLNALTAEKALAAGDELNDFLNQIIDLKIKSPGNDLLSRMVHEQMLPGHFKRSDLLSLSRLLLIAGHDSTANMISLSTLLLFQHPDALAEIRASNDPALVRNAVDEMLRFVGASHQGRRRAALADVEVGGQLIRAGEGVIILNNVMDRDDTVFSNPNQFDIHRDNARASNAFGYGIHMCPGQLLARMELTVVHATLWKRIPTLQLAVPFSELHFVDKGPKYDVEELPVTW